MPFLVLIAAIAAIFYKGASLQNALQSTVQGAAKQLGDTSALPAALRPKRNTVARPSPWTRPSSSFSVRPGMVSTEPLMPIISASGSFTVPIGTSGGASNTGSGGVSGGGGGTSHTGIGRIQL